MGRWSRTEGALFLGQEEARRCMSTTVDAAGAVIMSVASGRGVGVGFAKQNGVRPREE